MGFGYIYTINNNEWIMWCDIFIQLYIVTLKTIVIYQQNKNNRIKTIKYNISLICFTY